MPTRRAPQTITLLSDLIVSRSQPVSSVSVWTLSPLDRLVRLCSWVYLNREHYQQLMRTTWPIHDCSKVVSLLIFFSEFQIKIVKLKFKPESNYSVRYFEIYSQLGNLFTMAIFGTYSRDGRTMPTRRAPQTITLLSDLIVQEPAGQQRQCLDPQSAGPAGALVFMGLFKPRALSTTYANDLAYSRLFKGCVLAYIFFRILD